ncbi:ShlB/FhaC/HecB family hemolysin secretion/activation protein [Roseibium salinum]|uniref:ShlB/FhaC/HecB family hemolysin secretion/activation protein n=2 Tax=Roseibium salinum TaxID=1604349 RepID=A0ABT3QZS9_9HYPH|nr:ShlB/FhaC/HecB family hemolysin secretion/activation protein [Roseibium sp. DSM 29163]MCX2722356.1 ShlB/FhaC/HecB family hemolysin secretion/activation protein [Roseibium sp. DSM 29163]
MPAQDAIQQSEELQRRQRDLLDEQDRLLKQTLPPVGPVKESDREPTATQPGDSGPGPCIDVGTVVFEKATVFPDARLQELVPADKCFALEQIFGLVRDTTNLYVDAGYVTSRAYLPEQDLSTGTLRIQVVEGRIEQVQLRQNGKLRKTGYGVLPSLNGKLLQIRRIEQGLDQINSLSSKDAKISFQPGSTAGMSIVVVDITSARPWQATVGVDNSGAESTGKAQFEGSFSIEDLFGQFETISISHKHSDPSLDESQISGNTSLYITVPRGMWTWRWSSSYYNYLSEVESQVQSFKTTGTNWSHKGEIERLLFRDQVSKTYGRASLNFKEAENYLEDALLETSSRVLSVGRLEFAHTRRFLGGSLSARLGIDQGLPLWGAPVDNGDADSSVPKAQFTKFDGELGLSRGWAAGGGSLFLSSRVRGQYTPVALFGSEQLGIGGASSVRGFDTDSLSAENGFYSRNEVSFAPDIFSQEQLEYLGQLSLFAGLDAGWQFEGPSTPGINRNLMGAAIGARLQGGWVFGEISYERPLLAPDDFNDEPVLRLRAGLTLSKF